MIGPRPRAATSLIELLVVLGITSLVFGLVLTAVQGARGAASRLQCSNNLRQIGLACHEYHDTQGMLPPGLDRSRRTTPYPYLSWMGRLMPFLDQDNLWRETTAAYARRALPFGTPAHPGLKTVLPVFGCPSDGRVREAQLHLNTRVALTSYLGNGGSDVRKRDGLFFVGSRVNFSAVSDGLSNTLLAGERPPSPDFRFGWWYAGVGQLYTGSVDYLLGANEINLLHNVGPYGGPYDACPRGPYSFGPGSADNPCDVFHFWSLHSGGANFVFADGSVRFLGYSRSGALTALATRAGGEIASPDE